MAKQMKKERFVELRDDLILLGIVSAHKYVGSLVTKSPSAVKHNTHKKKKEWEKEGGHERKVINDITFLPSR